MPGFKERGQNPSDKEFKVSKSKISVRMIIDQTWAKDELNEGHKKRMGRCSDCKLYDRHPAFFTWSPHCQRLLGAKHAKTQQDECRRAV